MWHDRIIIAARVLNIIQVVHINTVHEYLQSMLLGTTDHVLSAGRFAFAPYRDQRITVSSHLFIAPWSGVSVIPATVGKCLDHGVGLREVVPCGGERLDGDAVDSRPRLAQFIDTLSAAGDEFLDEEAGSADH